MPALPECRLERVHGADHSQEISGGEQLLALPERRCRRDGDSFRLAVQNDRQLRAKNIREAGEENAEVDSRIRELRDRGKNLSRPVAGDDVDDSQELVFGDEAESFAHAIGRHRPLANRDHLIGETEGIAHGSVGGAGDHRQRILRCLDALCPED